MKATPLRAFIISVKYFADILQSFDDTHDSSGAQRKKEVRSPLLVEFGNPVDQNIHSCYYRFWPGGISKKYRRLTLTVCSPELFLPVVGILKHKFIYLNVILYATYSNTYVLGYTFKYVACNDLLIVSFLCFISIFCGFG